jgi:hypothetical protein
MVIGSAARTTGEAIINSAPAAADSNVLRRVIVLIMRSSRVRRRAGLARPIWTSDERAILAWRS